MSKNNKNDRDIFFRDDMQIMMDDLYKQIDFSVFRSDYLVGKLDDNNNLIQEGQSNETNKER